MEENENKVEEQKQENNNNELEQKVEILEIPIISAES